MSRLDYVTVGIVAICLAALGFLVFKTVGLMNGEAETETPAEYANPDPIDTTRYDTTGGFTDPAFSSTEALDNGDDYSEEDDKSRDIVSDKKTQTKTPATTTTKGASEPAKKTETKEPAKKEETATRSTSSSSTATKSKEKEPSKSTTTTGSTTAATKTKKESGGRYAVQVGAFSTKANADVAVKNLKKLGYDSAESLSFNGKVIAIADRFSSNGDAATLVKNLQSKHNIEAIVKPLW